MSVLLCRDNRILIPFFINLLQKNNLYFLKVNYITFFSIMFVRISANTITDEDPENVCKNIA